MTLPAHGTTLRRLGAGRAARHAARRRPGVPDDPAGAGGGWTAAGGPRRTPGRRGRRLRLPARRGHHPAAGPPVPAAARGRPRACRRTFDAGSHEWADGQWPGRGLQGAVIYELHVGTFTPEGTFDAAIEKLDYLVGARHRLRGAAAGERLQRHPQLGLRRRPLVRRARRLRRARRYQRFVDAAHAAGLGVIQDVVYNHLGPSGQLPPRFGPYLNRGRATPGATRSTSTAPAPTSAPLHHRQRR